MCLLLLFSMAAQVQASVDIPLNLSEEGNYIVEVVLPGGGTSVDLTNNNMSAEGTSQAQVTVSYYDGLGRPVQTSQIGFTASGADLLSTVCYDDAGREYRHGLPVPFTGNKGGYVNSTVYGQAAQTYYEDTYLYRETLYENSPLSRVVGSKNPGMAWNSRPKTTAYRTNLSGEAIILFRISSGGVQRVGYYAAGSLYVTRETDEDGIWQERFTDKLGRDILIRQGGEHDTYYLYDDHNRLCYVLPPKAVDAMYNIGNYPDSHTTLQQYAYLYKYDDRGNCIEKRLPGCKSILMIYDKANRLVMKQDGNQEDKSLWTITKYDAFSRELYIYEANPLRSPGDLRQYCKDRFFVEERADAGNGAWSGMGYTIRILPPATSDYRLLTVNYYDDYSFLSLDEEMESELAYQSKEGYGTAYTSAKGLLTGSQVFDLTDKDKFKITAHYYDAYGNLVQSRTRHVSGDYEMTYIQCDLLGNILQSYVEHLDPQGELLVSEHTENTYDRSGRLTRSDYRVDDDLSTSSRYEYDELGRVARKSLNGGLTYATYGYNLQGWISQIQDVDFIQNLYYENPMGNSGTALYNGNVSAMNWIYPSENDTIVNGYRFTYDNHDRLTTAYSVTGSNFSSGHYYTEYLYDKHGNMTSFFRYGGSSGQLLDEMNLCYEGNQVVEVTDMMGNQDLYDQKEYRDYNQNGLDYSYDDNGNMITDLDRNIVTIRYNLLNLPDTVQFRNGAALVNYYTADGKKYGTKYLTPLASVVIPEGATFGNVAGTLPMDSYVSTWQGSLEYAGEDFESDTLIRIHKGDFYLDYPEEDFRYYARDYQGNIRTVYGKATFDIHRPPRPGVMIEEMSSPILVFSTTRTYQRMQYYPFGLPYDACYKPEEQPYKYGGKEFIEMHGYDTYDFDARMYYPALCRFMTMDPLCEKYYATSPYAYCNNNPVKYIDPDGKDVWEIDYEGRIINRIKDKTQDAFYMVEKDSNGDYQRTFSEDKDGNKVYDSISFEDGTIESQLSASYDIEGERGTYDEYKIRGDGNATALFDFMSRYITRSTLVEVGLAQTGIEGEKGLNFITTGHVKGKEPGGSQIMPNRLYYGYTIRTLVHSHPNSKKASDDDDLHKNQVNGVLKSLGLHIPTYKIYFVGTKENPVDPKYITY